MSPTVSVVIPAHDAERTLGAVLAALAGQDAPPDEVIVVDDASTDRPRRSRAGRRDRRPRTSSRSSRAAPATAAGRRRAATSSVFLDSDAIPQPGWGAGLRSALPEFPGALVGCARTFEGHAPWGWVAHLQIETPYLPRGAPRRSAFLSSYCLAVPREAPMRFDSSYGGEDGVFSADALAAGYELVFDPRFHAFHDHARETYGELRRQQQRLAYGLARIGSIQREGLHKRILARVPAALLRARAPVLHLPPALDEPELRDQFRRNLPRMVARGVDDGAERAPVRDPPPAAARQRRGEVQVSRC